MPVNSNLTTVTEIEARTAFKAITGRDPRTLDETRGLYFQTKLRFEYEVLKQRGLALELTREKETDR